MNPANTSATLFFLTLFLTSPLTAQTLSDPLWWLNSTNRFDMVLLIMKSQQIEQDRKQELMEARARLRAEQLRKKAAELLETAHRLNVQLEDVKTVEADTPRLARRCEGLSKEIKRLLRRPR